MRSLLELLDERNIEYEECGDLYRAFCPLHDDKNKPNFFVYPDTNSFFCYSCQEGGSPVDFLVKHDGYTLREALKIAAVKDPGIRLRLRKRQEESPSLEMKDFRKQLNARVSKIFHKAFEVQDSKKVLELMKELDRRLSDEKVLTYRRIEDD